MESPRSFGKPGRPVKDAVGERLRIYQASAPLILARGVKGTRLRDIARASCLSPGGIYHYFRSKAEIALYGLHPEALSRACTDAGRSLAAALPDGARRDAQTAVELYVERNLLMLELVRPALLAAIELGRTELRDRLAIGLRDDADALISTLRSLDPGMPCAPDSAEALRRTILGLALDDGVTTQQARRQLKWLLRRILSRSRRGIQERGSRAAPLGAHTARTGGVRR